MKTTVTFETAKALQDAGFPKPEPAEGQFWYAPSGVLFLMFHVATNGNYELQEIGRDNTLIGRHWSEWIFAPQAHDILEQLAKDVYPNLIRADISSYNSEFPKQVQAPQLCIYSLPDNQLSALQFEFQKNPHEAAAKAYLQLQNPA